MQKLVSSGKSSAGIAAWRAGVGIPLCSKREELATESKHRDSLHPP